MTTIINAKQLFLLCALRKDSVKAMNLSEYTWTIRHDNTFNERFIKSEIRGEDFEKLLRAEIQKEFPIQKPDHRNFGLHRGEMGYSLSDTDADMSWYSPVGKLDDWCYKGNFKIDFISELENQILFDLLVS